jgi:regulator of protease activity HflC (stomatin/prohibitin superfamily)
MKKFLIRHGTRGLLVRDGRLVRFLRPGLHRVFNPLVDASVTVVDVTEGLHDLTPEVEALLPADEVTVFQIPADHMAVVTRLGRPFRLLPAGRVALWLDEAQLQVGLVDLRPLRTQLPVGFSPLAAHTVLQDVVVRPFERALVWVDGVLDEVLGAGRHGLSTHDRKVEVSRIDMREQELQVGGQELITRDKVTLRLNLILKHRVVDPVAAVEAVDSLHDALHAEVQLVARAVVAATTVDELLERRGQLAGNMVDAVAQRAKTWGTEVLRLEIKDIVLPGDMKVLLNQVVEADKRAQALNILRREEVAATRSLANTARLLEQNPTLRRLKEVESIKEIADRIGNLTVVVSPKDLLQQIRIGDAE